MFITFEGGEGTGKSTQSKLLLQSFEAAGIPVLYTREPGGSEGAESIRNLVVNGDVARWDDAKFGYRRLSTKYNPYF